MNIGLNGLLLSLVMQLTAADAGKVEKLAAIEQRRASAKVAGRD